MQALIALLFLAASANTTLPFWTEKSTYTEGERLYAVGVSTANKDEAAARQEAFEAAKTELSNMLQVSDLSPLTLNTQRTFARKTKKGFIVYRLVWVNSEKALDVKKEAAAQTRERLEEQASAMEAQAKELQPVLDRYLEAQSSLKEVEAKALELEKKWKAKRVEARKLSRAIQRKIASRSALVCEIKKWMTHKEVLALIGPPDQKGDAGGGMESWRYGASEVIFKHSKVQSVPRRRCD